MLIFWESFSWIFLRSYYLIIFQLPVISFTYPSETGKCIFLLETLIILWYSRLLLRYNGRLQTSSEEKPCLSQITHVQNVDTCLLEIFMFAFIRSCRLLKGLQNRLSLLCSLFLVSFVFFLEWYCWGRFSQNV